MIAAKRSITVVQSLAESWGAEKINRQKDGYHLWTRGIQHGLDVDEFVKIESIDRAIVAADEWGELVAVAMSDALKLVVSNTTAKGLSLDESDEIFDPEKCPASFPAKLTALLFARFKAGFGGLTILPMELVENNAGLLQDLVLEQASRWDLSAEFCDWLKAANDWLRNLVDRIVVSPSGTPPWGTDDELAVMTEPFQMLAIEKTERVSSHSFLQHPAVQWVDDLNPITLRKVRILNGLHTAMVAHCLPLGFETVLDVMNDADQRKWLEELLFDEILVALQSRGMSEESFAQKTLERFENPFFEHRLKDISLNHESKLAVRLQPTYDEFVAHKGLQPQKLQGILRKSL